MDKNTNNTSILYLIPNVISEGTSERVITEEVRSIITKLDYFIVENVRSARRFISSLKLGIRIEDLHFEILDKNTSQEELNNIMRFAEEGKSAGVLSEAGCPGIADPGALAVQYAHRRGIRVMPLTGPSSILMALIAAGFNGQRFAFHGYLPIDKGERSRKIKELESESRKYDQTQIFMETPYRNQALYQDLIKFCDPNTQLCIAVDITGSNESIQTKAIRKWKTSNIHLGKTPAVFLIYHP